MNWSKSNYKSTLIVVFLLLNHINLTAQDVSEWQKKYAGFNELILLESQTYDISVQKNKLRVIQDNYYESVILTEMGIHNTSETFGYSELVPLLNYEAYSAVQIKGREKKFPIKTHADKADDQSNIFHTGAKERKIVFSNLEVGAKKVYKYQSEFIDPFLLHRFPFSNIFPMQKTKFEVIADKDVEIGYKIFNDPDHKISFSKTERKGRITYSWELVDAHPIKYESDSPGYLYIAPHIVLFVKSYISDKQKIELLGTTDNLYNYYQNFVGTINQSEDQELKKITQELIKDKNSDREKIKAIHYWVQDNIKYVAFEEGYEGFIPREAGLVNQRKFGDCKDMASIITEMAKYASVPNVNFCWIGTRKLPYSYHDVSTPAVDNHMIAAVEIDGEIIFLDATDSQSSFGLPSSFIQGKEALISNGKTYKIVEVPVISGSKNTIDETLKVTLDQNTIKGSGTISFNGLARTNAIRFVGNQTSKARLESVKNLIIKGNNKFNLKNYKEHNFTDKDESYTIDFDFDLDNYLIKAGSDSYLNLFLDKPFEKITIEKNRKSMYEFDILIRQSYNIEFEVPADKKLTYIPKNASLDNELLKYDITYTQKDNKLMLHFMIESKKILLEQDDFELWNQTIKDLKSHYNEMIVIKNQ
jgi:hypothetical protein